MFDVSALLILAATLTGYSVLGYGVARFLLPSRIINLLNEVVFYLILPSFIFSSIMKGFSPGILDKYWVLIMFQPVYMIIGYGIYKAVYTTGQSLQEDKASVGTYTFQNSGYIPIALFSTLLTGQEYTVVINMLFILLIGYNLVMFSVGESYYSRKLDMRVIFNVVTVTILVSMVIAVSGARSLIPESVMYSTGFLGSLTVPLVMFSLGGSIYYSSQCSAPMGWNKLARLFIGKALLFPCAALAIIALTSPDKLTALLIFCQAIMPPAANLIILARHDHEVSCVMGSYIFYSYLLALVYIPAWLYLFSRLSFI